MFAINNVKKYIWLWKFIYVQYQFNGFAKNKGNFN